MKLFLQRALRLPSVLAGILCLQLGCQSVGSGTQTTSAAKTAGPPFGELLPETERRVEALAQFSSGVSKQLTQGLDAALPYYEEAVRLDPHNLRHGIELAKVHLKRKEFADAASLLQGLIAANPKEAELHFLLGVTYTSWEKPDQAMPAFQEAYRLDPTDINTVQALLYRHLESSDVAAAGKLLERASKHLSDDPAYWLRLGDLCLAARRQEPALQARLTDQRIITYFENGLSRTTTGADETSEPDTNLGELLARLATLSEEIGQPEKAKSYYERLAVIRPDDVALQLKLADSFLKEGKQEQAAAALEAVIKLEPLRFVQVYNQLAALYEELGNNEQALATYQQSVAVKPDQLPPYLQMALIHLEQQNFSLAHEMLTVAGDKFPQAYQVAFYRGLAFHQQKEFDHAVGAFDQARELATQSPQPIDLPAYFYFSYGGACERAGQIDKAATLLKRAIELDPNNHAAHNYLGYMWAEHGMHLDEAHQLILKALTFEPENGAYLDSLGWVLFQLGRSKEALGYLERAADLVGDDPIIFEHLADVLLDLGRTDEARPYLEQALQLDPENQKLRQKLEQLKNESAISNRT